MLSRRKLIESWRDWSWLLIPVTYLIITCTLLWLFKDAT